MRAPRSNRARDRAPFFPPRAPAVAYDHCGSRAASIGGSPDGRAAGLVRRCRGPEYPLGRADALRHVAALDQEYGRVVTAHRSAAHRAEADPVTHDLLTAQSAELERFHWFVSAHTQSDSS
ncbi:hypothetical protein GCM10009817_09120 [Terrabacter lapilli]|uniref:Ferritin/DPS domain-containing protein n=1 Tax=Terrabacter lapilli TaxID=436231 RepID=A0ABN2RLW7_9MICO